VEEENNKDKRKREGELGEQGRRRKTERRTRTGGGRRRE
jgi:hypothetical protein